MPSEIKSPGGLAFELVWEKPSKDPAKVLNSTPSKDDINVEKRIREKQIAAEERRKSMESSRLEQMQKKQQRMVEARAKAEELDKKFKETSAVKLTEKLGKVEEKQKACREDLLLKLKEHDERIEKVRERKKVIGENGDASPTCS
ncbi:Stathmin-1-A [Holothuria leucospilota]|uniref:Stathmin n=1 Tax=Holothuria leucospilota TaxID=206669 RepID=A0A9Q1BU09_HOLLE|nr:Stathmin-1-A [Holothuria leucospilota]